MEEESLRQISRACIIISKTLHPNSRCSSLFPLNQEELLCPEDFPPSPYKSKMGRRKDPCWEHAKNLSAGSYVSFQCNYCLDTYKGGASRLKAHLSGKKNSGIGPCSKVPDDVVEKLSGHKRASPDMENENVSFSLPSSLDPNLRQRVLEEKKDKTWVDDKLVRFLTVFDLPFESLKSPIFSDFVKAVAQYGSDYELPDPYALSNLSEVYNSRVRSYVNKVEKTSREIGCTLIVDNGGLYTYSPCGVLYQCARTERSDYGKEGSDDETLHAIRSCVHSIGPKKVLQIFFDDRTLLSTLKNSLIQRYEWMNVGYSPTHEILGLWQDIFELNSLRQTLDLAYTITTEIDNHWTRVRVDKDKYHATFGICPRLEFTKSEDNIDDFWRLQSLLKFRDEGQKFVIQDTIKAKYCGSYVDHLIGCEKFWVQVKAWVSVLHSLLEALRSTSNRMSPPSAYFCEILEELRGAIEKCHHRGQDDIDRLVQLFWNFRSRVMHPIYEAAVCLDPAYMYKQRAKDSGGHRRGVDFILTYLVETHDERRTFENEFRRYRTKDPDIFTTTATSVLESYHPATWWKSYGDCVPTLRKYAIGILSQPCSSLRCYELDIMRKAARYNQDAAAAAMMENFEKLETQTTRATNSNLGSPEWLDEYETTERSIDEYKIPHLADLLADLEEKQCPFCKTSLVEWLWL